jgi:hypothetical protein
LPHKEHYKRTSPVKNTRLSAALTKRWELWRETHTHAEKKPSTYKSDYHRMRNHGVSQEDYQSMLSVVPGCAICGGPPSGKNRAGKPLEYFSVDHDHKTGRVRGLLCQDCNVGLGRFKDDPKRLAAAIEYLREPGDNHMTIEIERHTEAVS